MTSTEQEVEKGRKVHYGVLKVQEDFPVKPAGQGRPSPLMATVEAVMADEAKVGKAVLIAEYESKTACGAAANVLRQRFGRTAAAKGVEFATRKHTVKNKAGEIEEHHGLWMIFDPNRIVGGEWTKHEKSEAERLAKLAAKRTEKAAGNGSEPSAKAGGTQPHKAPTKG